MGPYFPKSSVWDLGWGALPATNPFLKNSMPIQVLMQGQKELECMKTRQPRLNILLAPQMWIKRVSKNIFGNLYFWIYTVLFLIYICFALCFCMFLHWHFLFFAFCVCSYFLFTFLRRIFCITCCIFSRFTISKFMPTDRKLRSRNATFSLLRFLMLRWWWGGVGWGGGC